MYGVNCDVGVVDTISSDPGEGPQMQREVA